MQARFLAILALLVSVTPAIAQPEHSDLAAPGEIVLPFHLNKEGYPLIAASVNDTSGVFLLDTGDSDRFLLNRNYIPMDTGTPAGGGMTASGQALDLRWHTGHYTAILAGVLSAVASSGDRKNDDASLSVDARQEQEDIDPHFLGWLGWGFLKAYVTTIDYRDHTLRLLPVNSAPRTAHPLGSIVVSFAPSSPVVPFTTIIGQHPTPAILDTAGWDRLALQPSSWAKVMAAHTIRRRPGKDCVTLRTVSVGEQNVDVVDVERAERSMERLTLGIGFLRRFTSTWDPRDGTVTLVPNGTRAPRRGDCS
ncbi:hypothetical protein [Sphingomonas sp. PR090111-T3T-6A]|uniref:hypothetical protein n=1 Tax=Sphingomonas sp. PR090111-T3T-6A TaxID=685778 RepID=UPI0012FB7314|nr:hypothetical protein [Sphingomonas sp. PR090111-T3T-6A]